jgi:hypothetical protein
LPVCTLAFDRLTLTGVFPILPATLFQKIKPRYMRGVCVYHLNRCKTVVLQGVPGIIASLALTKTLALICDIRKGRLSDVPANFTGMGRGSTQEPPRRLFANFNFLVCSAASEPSSAFSPKPCRRHYFDFSELFRRTMAPMYMGYFLKTMSPNYF